METNGFSLLEALGGRMRFLSRRAGVITENIANADTPNFIAKDLKPSGFGARARAAMRASDPRHFGYAAGAASRAREVAAPDAEASLNGNRVSLETQAMKIAETRSDYSLAAAVYRRSVNMLRLAARGQ